MLVLVLGQVHSFDVQGEFKSDPRMMLLVEDEELMMKDCLEFAVLN